MSNPAEHGELGMFPKTESFTHPRKEMGQAEMTTLQENGEPIDIDT